MHILELRIPPLLVTIIFTGLMWSLAMLTPSLTFDMPGRVILALVLAIAGITVILAGVVAFRKASTTVNPIQPETSSSLVTFGVYRISRNPMYLGFLLVLLGWAAFLSNLFSFLGVLLFVMYMNQFQIRPEERKLRDKFGEEFAIYAQSTRRWF